MLKRYVLTGAPGSGKTSILRVLQERGWSVVDEAATDVIASEQAHGVDEPWKRGGFVDKIVALQRERQQIHVPARVQVQFHDRSPFCTLALAKYLRRPVTTVLAKEIARVTQERIYERTVFLIRPIGFVAPTSARRISYQDSLTFESVHEATYQAHGFETIYVEPAEVGQRAADIEAWLRRRPERTRRPPRTRYPAVKKPPPSAPRG